MGLLDNLPEALTSDQGLLGLALMASGAPRAGGRTSLGEGLLGAAQMVAAQKRAREAAAMKAQLQQAQMGLLGAQLKNTEAQAAEHAAKSAKMQALLGSLQNWMSGQRDVQGANADTVAQTGNLAPTVQNGAIQQQSLQQRAQSNPLFGIPQQAIQADLAFNDGKGIAEMLFKRGAPNIDFINGVAVDKNRTQAGASIPQISNEGRASQLLPDPTAPGGYRVVVPPGAMEAFSGYTSAAEAAKAPYTLVDAYKDGVPGKVPLSSIVGNRPPPMQQTQQQAQPGRFDPLEMARAEAISSGKQVDYNIGGQRGSFGGGGQDGFLQTGPSAREKATTETTTLGNQTFMKDSYTPALQAGDAARSTITSVQSARNALSKLGTTGWGTETRAAAASVLGALGVPQADRFATNAQQFEAAIGQQNWTLLNAAKGPQTEGDAQRAAKTLASLKGTPAYNAFNLDLTQAMAERDAMKADYFRKALPFAQKNGDLQEIERRWLNVMPSIWKSPIMQKWNVNE